MNCSDTEFPETAAQWIGEGRDSVFVGSVSGGCIEGVLIAEAHAAMKDGKIRLLEFRVADENAWSVGLACGGRHAARLACLKAHGFADDALARIHGPIGLAIAAKSPAEIAVSILAQMTERLRGPA